MRLRRSKGVVDTEEEEEEDDSSMLLSLSVKPDRNMALLDDYEMEELDFVPENPNHRSGLFSHFLVTSFFKTQFD